MRVLVVLGTSAGGVGNHVRGLVGSLTAAGHHVVVACPPEVDAHFGLHEVATARGAARAVRPPAPGPRRPGRARPAAGWSAVPTWCTPTGCGPPPWRCWPSGAASVPVVATLHNAAPSAALTGAVYAALERVVALRSTLVLGVSADLVERMRRLGARRTGLAVVAAPPRRAATRDRYAVHADLGLAGSPRSPSSWRGWPRRRGSTCCSTPWAS